MSNTGSIQLILSCIGQIFNKTQKNDLTKFDICGSQCQFEVSSKNLYFVTRINNVEYHAHIGKPVTIVYVIIPFFDGS